ncbi:TlpA family protein disulfide reductase [Flavobacterium sp. RHBU_24]|uniref:TlpA family protein disulfide reductase n=1 Tax=Flavobacterium sp. RHBU_24 TaxID=3391185 RepID=UPI003984D16C
MYKFYKFTLLLTLLVILSSCGGNDNYTAYFAGQVKNPRLPYLLFSNGNTIIDTIKLDKNNRFFVKFDSLAPGLYTFKHEPDYQFVYFEKNDSLTVAIDAGKFDESIVFSGRGDRKNNFLMEQYLLSDTDRKNSYALYANDCKGFIKTIDSLYKLRKTFYEKNKDDIAWSDEFDFFALNRLNLNYYTKKEYYPYIHARRTGKDIRPELPKDYYEFRKGIDFNDARLANFSPFIRYSNGLINNLAFSKTKKHGIVKENTLQYNINRLNVADSLFKNQDVKNQALNNIAFAYLLEDQNIANNQRFLQRYDELSTDDSNENEIKQISAAIKKLNPGSKLPDIGLEDLNGKPFNIATDIDKKTVIFFWTSCAHVQVRKVYNRVAQLKKQHPDVAFIAINVDNDTEWKKNLPLHGAVNAGHLRATDFEQLRQEWVLTKINRTIILNGDGTIKNAFTNLLDETFSNSL